MVASFKILAYPLFMIIFPPHSTICNLWSWRSVDQLSWSGIFI